MPSEFESNEIRETVARGLGGINGLVLMATGPPNRITTINSHNLGV